jgi:hypothetical protein
MTQWLRDLFTPAYPRTDQEILRDHWNALMLEMEQERTAREIECAKADLAKAERARARRLGEPLYPP